jgi:hypothetical protein
MSIEDILQEIAAEIAAAASHGAEANHTTSDK